MSDAAIPEFRGPCLDNDEVLLRLVWDSDDLDPNTRELSTSAFSKGDLRGVDNGLSVDREELAVKAVIMHLAKGQQLKAEDNDSLNREAPLISKVSTYDVCNLRLDDDSDQVFVVISTPIPESLHGPANPAHAEILNVSGKFKPSELNKIRTKLQPLFSSPAPLDDVLTD